MKKIITASLFALALILWLATGINDSKSQQTSSAKKDRAFEVVTRVVPEQDFILSQLVRGRVDVDRSVLVGANTEGQVIATPFKEGDYVKAGDVLCQIEMADRELRVGQAQTELTEAQLNYEGILKLEKRGNLQSKLALAQAQSRLASAKVALAQAELNVAYASVEAPFDGVLEALLAEQGSYIQKGGHCAQVLDVTPYIFTGLVSEYDIAKISKGDRGVLLINNDVVTQGEIRFVARQVDAQTRSYTVEAALLGDDVRAGQTASFLIQKQTVRAHLVLPSALNLDDSGAIAVRIVDEQSRVQSVPVTLLEEVAEGIWVSGLSGDVAVIELGAGFAVPGEIVAVASE